MDKAIGGRVEDGSAPRFVLVELAATDLGRRLRSRDWFPIAAAGDLSSVGAAVAAGADVLVLCCTERQFLTPSTQADSERVASTIPRLAVVSGAGPDVVAYGARFGWSGFVPATASTARIARAILAVSRGSLAFPLNSLQSLVHALALVAPIHEPRASALTPRQQQIVTLIAQGSTDAEIAAMLGISRSTAHKHVQNARHRLRAKTRSQLVATSRDMAHTQGQVARARIGIPS